MANAPKKEKRSESKKKLGKTVGGKTRNQRRRAAIKRQKKDGTWKPKK